MFFYKFFLFPTSIFTYFCNFASNIKKLGKKNSDKIKFIVTFSITVALLAAVSHLFFPKNENKTTLADKEQMETDNNKSDSTLLAEANHQETDNIDSDSLLADAAILDTSLMEQQTNQAELFANSKVWSYPECFPDSNSLQLAVAERNGVKPMATREQAYKKVEEHLLGSIMSSPYYAVDELTHSMPYLVPRAQQLLNAISINFLDSLISKGLEPHLPIVTSALRTTGDIQNLRRGNRNSVKNSCHCYGTTIDITYNRFMPLNSNEPTRYDERLKKVMAEVLFDLREQGKCYVKYERRQACFHLTVI